MMMNQQLKIAFTFVVTTVAACIGCNTTVNDLKTGKSFYHDWPVIGHDKDDAPEPYPNPVKMATTWSPDTLVQNGHTPTRGFGGRIYFYDEKSNAVPVEGKLIIHGFDDTAGSDNDGENVRRYEFTPEQFTRHFSQSDLGASYSIWVPWDAVGGTQRRISMVASFETLTGKFVQGEPATILLPGTNPELPEAADKRLFSSQYQQHRRALAAGDSSRGMTTTTIARGDSRARSKGNKPPPTIATTRSGQLNVKAASMRLRK